MAANLHLPVPAISVILAAFNASGYLDACLAGLAAQTFTDFEVVAVDDGSTDDTLALLQRWAKRDSRIHVHWQPNGGGYRARAMGITHAAGQHLTFVDPDDRVEPTFLADMRDVAIRASADIVVTGFDRVDAASNRRLSTEMTSFGDTVISVHPYEARLLSINTSLWNKLFRASVFAGLWPLSQPPTLGDDALIFLRALVNSDCIAFLPKVEYHYAVRVDSVVQTFSTAQVNSLRDSLLAVKGQVGTESRSAQFGELIDALAFLHIGLSGGYRLIVNHAAGATATVRDNVRFLDLYFAGWRRTRLLLTNNRYRLMRIAARVGLLPLALKSVTIVLRVLRRDLSW